MSQRWPLGHDAEPQQTPSTQLPDWHCGPLAHDAPIGCGVGVAVGVGVRVGAWVHCPACPGALQTCPEGQVCEEQQTPLVQKSDAHCAGSVHGVPGSDGVVHTPSDPGMSQRWFRRQDAVEQQIPLTQKPRLHCDPAVQGVPGSLGGPQLPVLQNSASGQLCVPQQAPSTQNCDWHWAGSVHPPPFGLGMWH